MKGDSGMETHLLLFHLLKPLPRQQRIQLHAFKGNHLVVGWWLKFFPTPTLVLTGVWNTLTRSKWPLKWA
ncbi:hypothetical protein DPMN_121006 [Dreissena polymorpha]|uniref:Uncharacterized protein n=1 Tax=Dreissena polymorpha TaxID=45954 RepID=A0A9D4GSQ6_DREPO|nr:hypothetical protein DPMN_121006 [Dreissena polymorpha]